METLNDSNIISSSENLLEQITGSGGGEVPAFLKGPKKSPRAYKRKKKDSGTEYSFSSDQEKVHVEIVRKLSIL